MRLLIWNHCVKIDYHCSVLGDKVPWGSLFITYCKPSFIKKAKNHLETSVIEATVKKLLERRYFDSCYYLIDSILFSRQNDGKGEKSFVKI